MTVHSSGDPIGLQILNIGETLQALQPNTWKANRAKIQASFVQCSSLSADKISFLVETVVRSIRNHNNDIRQDIYSDLADSNILNISLLKNLPNTLSPNEILILKTEIAKEIFKKDNEIFYDTILDCQIDSNSPEGLAALKEIAKFAIKSSKGSAIKYIKDFTINPNTIGGQSVLIELAKFSAEIDCTETSKHIKEFQIKNSTPGDQLTFIEIAKIAAKELGIPPFSKFIKNYGINSETPDGQLALIEIAKIAAHTHQSGIAEHIQNYDINHNSPEGQLALIEVAKITAQKNVFFPSYISKYIKNFRIDYTTNIGQFALIEIAKIAAHADASGVSQFIQNYGINPKTKEGNFALIEIAKIVAHQKSEEVSRDIQNYDIDHNTREGQIALIEIAKIAAHRSGFGVTCYIQNYSINTDPEGQIALIEIAKIAAHSFNGISDLIQKYSINSETSEGQRALIEIAKIAAKKDGFRIALVIQTYCINSKTPEGQIALIEIAKIAAKHSFIKSKNWDLSTIKNFEIDFSTFEGKSALIEIFRLHAKVNNILTINKFPKNLITNSIEWMQAYSFAGFLYLGSLSFNGNEEDKEKVNEASNNLMKALGGFNFGIGNFQLIMNLFEKFNNESLLELCVNTWDHKIKSESSNSKKKNQRNSITAQIASLLNQIEFPKPSRMDLKEYERIQQTNSMWLKSILGILSLQDISSEEMTECFLPIIGALLELKDPKLREILTNKLIFDFSNQESNQLELERNQLQSNVFTFCQQKPKNIGVLLCFLLTLLQQQGVQLPELLPYLTSLKGGSSTPVLKDAHFVKQLLGLLNQLYDQKELQAQDKEKLLQLMFVNKELNPKPNENMSEKERILQLIGVIKGIIDLGARDKLSKEHFLTQKDLENILLDTFTKIIPIKSGIEDLALKLVNLFTQFRDPKMIPIYGSVLKNGNELSALQAVAKTLEEIIEFKFPHSRYEESTHLSQIYEQRPDLKDLWQKNDEKDVTSLVEEFPFNASVSSSEKKEYHTFLLNSFTQNHVKAEFYPFLLDYLNEENSSERIRIIQKLSSHINSIDSDSPKDISNLELQLLLINLIDENNKDNHFNLLQKVIVQLPEPNDKKYSLQFDADIKALMQIVKTKQDNLKNPILYKNWKIVNSDHFVDLFSCGTEVVGSCQNINGSPDLNKCLMAYVRDGKNRLIAIKDETGKIQARAIFRLLIDSITHEPVLYLEKIYPQIHTPEMKHILLTMAKIQSQTLNLPLLTLKTDQGISYKSPIMSISSSAPFEYVDAGAGVTEGIFIINGAQIVA